MSGKLISSSIVKCGLLTALAFWNLSAEGDSVSNSSQGLEIVSPSHPSTFAACECPKMNQRLSWDSKSGMLESKVYYSTVPGVAVLPGNGAHPQTFVLSFPTICRSKHDELYVEAANQKVKIGHLKRMQSGRLSIQMDPGVNFIAHRVEGRLEGEIIISPSASTNVMR